MESDVIDKCSTDWRQSRGFKGRLTSKFTQSQMNVILPSNEKRDVEVRWRGRWSPATQCCALSAPHSQLWYDPRSHALATAFLCHGWRVRPVAPYFSFFRLKSTVCWPCGQVSFSSLTEKKEIKMRREFLLQRWTCAAHEETEDQSSEERRFPVTVQN